MSAFNLSGNNQSEADDLQLDDNSSDSNRSYTFDASCHGTSYDNDIAQLSFRIYFFASLFFVVVGLVGNTLSMLVFTSKDMLPVSSNVYLLLLAASDSLYLTSVFVTKTLTTMRCWYFPSSEADIVNHSQAACVLFQYLSDLFSDYSTCLILAFTVERSVAVFLPIKFKELCTVFRARLICGSIFVLIALTIAPHHVVAIGVVTGYRFCAILEEHEAMFAVVYVVEMTIYRVIPVFVIGVLNAFIIARVTRLTRDKTRRREAAQKLIETKRKKRRMKSEDRNLQLTIILILVSTSYVIAYVPVLLHFVLYKMFLSGLVDSGAWLDVVGNFSKALYISGFAINFFLYTVSGRVFRDQLKTLLCRPFASIRSKGNEAMTHCTVATSAPEASLAL